MSLRCTSKVFGRFLEVCYDLSYPLVRICITSRACGCTEHPLHTFTHLPRFPHLVRQPSLYPPRQAGNCIHAIANIRVVRSCPAASHYLGCAGPGQASSHAYAKRAARYFSCMIMAFAGVTSDATACTLWRFSGGYGAPSPYPGCCFSPLRFSFAFAWSPLSRGVAAFLRMIGALE
jgi:hypothetical protein